VDEVLRDVLNVEEREGCPGQISVDGSDDPGADAVVPAQGIADADEAGRLPEAFRQSGIGPQRLVAGAGRYWPFSGRDGSLPLNSSEGYITMCPGCTEDTGLAPGPAAIKDGPARDPGRIPGPAVDPH
jgi:hypothetical protein